MESSSYTQLLDRLKVPQPSLQKYAVISIFSKLRSAPLHLNADSEPGKDAIYQCLNSNSSSVADQAVRELCRLVTDCIIDVPRGVLELQSSLEGCTDDSKLVGLFVKGIGFLVRIGFDRDRLWRFGTVENHPFVKILSCQKEVQSELVEQILLFVAQNRQHGIVNVCQFLKPFLNFAIVRLSFTSSMSSSSSFVRDLISSMVTLSCSIPYDAMPVLKLLIECLRFHPRHHAEDFRCLTYTLESIIDAYIMILRHLVDTQSVLISEAQLYGVGLLDAMLSLCLEIHNKPVGIEHFLELSKRLLIIQYDLGLHFVSEMSKAMSSLFVTLIQSDLEHEQVSVLRLLILLLKWKSENAFADGVADQASSFMSVELLFIFPVINLMTSPSKFVKGVASDLLLLLGKLLVQFLVAQKNEVVNDEELPTTVNPGFIVLKLLQHLWYQGKFSSSSSFLSRFSPAYSFIKKSLVPYSWISDFREYSLWVMERRKSSLPLSWTHELFLSELPLAVGTIVAFMVMHDTLGSWAVDSLCIISTMDPKQGVTLLLAILYYINIFCRKDIDCPDMMLKLLEMLPSLASNSVMVPLVMQTILPMLCKDSEPVLYATAVRLLCKTCESNDRAFGSLQGVLLPKKFTEFQFTRDIMISMAASVRDICKKNPDRGVDLILSVSACIESQDPTIQAIGLESLTNLCEADVIDFYTAWDVIAKHVVDYLADALVAHGLCILLRWGAMDAEAYLEASKDVLQILWRVGFSRHLDGPAWTRARFSAFDALTHFEVLHIEAGIPDFKLRMTELLLSETNSEVLGAMEECQLKIISDEHINRRRIVKEKKITGNKVEKLLDVIPQALISRGTNDIARGQPGAALLCLSFTPKDVHNLGSTKGLQYIHARYENALVEIASSLQLSRNMLVAFLSLQSWKPFLHSWLKAILSSPDAKMPSIMLDKISKAANDILKSMARIAEEALPRTAENIGLAIGALCMVLPSSAHVVRSNASKFLLNWLFQYEHEHRQWSAAISLGLISSFLHVTDHKQRLDNISGLLEVACCSKRALVKGACGAGLGLSCQNLLAVVGGADGPKFNNENSRMQENELLGKIVRVLVVLMSRLTESSFEALQYLSVCSGLDNKFSSELDCESCEDLEGDIWGVAGLVLGLGSSLGAIYRAGAHDDVLKIKSLIISWFLNINPFEKSGTDGEISEVVLSVGSSIVVPMVVAFCLRVELMNNSELDHLMKCYKDLISQLVSGKMSDTFHQSLLMASCAGAGNLLACILNEGVYPVDVVEIKDFLGLFRKCYSNSYPPLVHFGGMFGVINALGAGAGYLIHHLPLTSSLQSGYNQKESSSLMVPLITSPVCEPLLTSMIQEIFLVAQNPHEHQLQQHAAWSLSFLRHHLWSQKSSRDESKTTQTVPEDSIAMKMSLWLSHLKFSEGDVVSHPNTVVSVLRCLSRAPRLPAFDWGAIIRRCMRYEVCVAEYLSDYPEYKKGSLREESLLFSLAHADHHDMLKSFLDDLSDLSRFGTLGVTLQSIVLTHLAGLVKLFSVSRAEKLFDDIATYLLSSSSPFKAYSPGQKNLLQVSCWKGLHQCLDEASLPSLEYLSKIEKCMDALLSLLPALQSNPNLAMKQECCSEEWFEAVECLGKAPPHWLLNLLEVSDVDLTEGQCHVSEVVKKIQIKARLTRMGLIPLAELGRLKAVILNSGSIGTWDVLVEVAAALQPAEISTKRQWLVDTVEISCVTKYPTKALQFLGLLAGSNCKYMPLLILDQNSVLSDLPVSLTSLLSDPSWTVIATSIASHLFTALERMYNWTTATVAQGDDTPNLQPSDKSEKYMAGFLLRVLHTTCVSLRNHMPFEKQLRLANMVVS